MYTDKKQRVFLAVPCLLGLFALNVSAGEFPLQGRATGRRYVLQNATFARSVKNVTTCSCCEAALIFGDGFESGDHSAWSASVTKAGEARVAAQSAVGRRFRIIPYTTVIQFRSCGDGRPPTTLSHPTEVPKP